MPNTPKETIKGFFEAYLGQRDLAKTLSYLLPEVQWVGTGKHEIVRTIGEAEEALKAEFAAEPLGYTLRFWGEKETCLGGGFAMYFTHLAVSRGEDEGKPVTLEIRVTAVCREGKIASIHASVPTFLQEEEEYFPMRFGERTYSELTKAVRANAAQLLYRCIPGGIVGGYMEEGRPLYYINEEMLSYLGFTCDEFLQATGGLLVNCIHPQDREKVKERITAMLDSGDFYEVDYRMLCKGGQYIWIHDIGKRVQAEDGRPVALSVCYDISDQVRLHQEMEQAAVELQGKNRELKELANNIPGGVVKCIFGGDLRTIYLSEGFCRMLGYSAQEIALGGSFYDFLWEEDRTRVQSELERAAEDICAKGSSLSLEYRLRTKGGSHIWVQETKRAILEDGVLYGYSVLMDITARHEMEQKLKVSEKRLSIALDQTTNLVFDYHIPTKQISFTEGRYQMDYSTLENVPDSVIQEGWIAPESLKDCREMFEDIQRGEKAASSEVLMRYTGEGPFVWVRISLTTIHWEDGRPVTAVGVMEDITARKEAERSFLKEEQYRQAMLSSMDAYGEINLTKNRFEKISGLWETYLAVKGTSTYQEIAEANSRRFVHFEDWDNYVSVVCRENLLRSYAAGNREIHCQHRRLNRDNQMVWMLLTIHLLADPDSGDVKALAYLKDINREKQRELELQYQAKKDPLTQLYNKGTAEALIRNILQEQKGSHTFFILDLDRFKEINDTYGHMFGDIVLSQAGKVLSQLFRSSDIVGRLGGDEFLVFMRNVPSQELVLRKAKEMCNAVSKLFEQDKGVFCSVGVSCCPEDGRSYEELYRRADKALYAAKNNGRNQFVLYREVEHGSQEGSFQLTNIDQEEPGNASGLSAVLERRYLSEQLLDQLDAIVYVSDPETYELYYVNRAMYSSSGYAEGECVGRKCYEAIMGRSEPCPFCTNDWLGFDKFYIWRHYNEVLRREYILKDKFILWNGKKARMEIAIDPNTLAE